MIKRVLAWIGLNETVMIVLTLFGIALGSFYLGYRTAAIQAGLELSKYVSSINAANAQAAIRNYNRLHAEQLRADAASIRFLAVNAENARLTDELKKRVTHVSTVYVETPGAAPQPLPDHPFTVGWVRDYNAALGLRLPASDAPASRAAGAAPGVSTARRIDPTDLARSAVSQADVLSTHHYNATICKKIEAQLSAIIDLDEGVSQ